MRDVYEIICKLLLYEKDAESIKELIPIHIGYWEALNLKGYRGAPFGDRSGGLILFYAKSLEAAEQTALNDPFVLQGVIESRWVKEWGNG